MNVVLNHNKPESLKKLGSGKVQISEGPVNSEDIKIIQGHGTLSLEIIPQKLEPISKTTEPNVWIKEQKQEKYKRDNSFKGVSIANTDRKVIPAFLKHTEQKNMKRVEYIEKPEGQKIKAQSVKDIVKYSDSEKLKKYEEKRMKRKANFKKKLEKREAMKHLVDR